MLGLLALLAEAEEDVIASAASRRLTNMGDCNLVPLEAAAAASSLWRLCIRRLSLVLLLPCLL